MNCKYVLLSGFLIRDIINGTYSNINFEKRGFNNYTIKSNDRILCINANKKTVRFVKELLFQASFVPKEAINE